jgi:Bor protein
MLKALLVSAALVSGACYKVTYVNPGTAPSGVVQGTKGHFLIFGIVGTAEIHAEAMCPGGVHQVVSKESFIDLLLGAITIGIYTPRTYEIECAAGGK